MGASYYALIANPAQARVWMIHIGLRATTLNCVHIAGDEAGGQLFFALETEAALTDGQWVDADSLGSLPLACPDHRALIADWLKSLPTIAAPWYRPGWREGALHWAQEQLTQRGLALTAEPEQVRAWERSGLWRFHTTGGRFYFKAVTETFAHEPRLSQALGEWLPHDCVPVLAIEPTRRWLLLGDAGPRSLLRDRDLAKWEAALRKRQPHSSLARARRLCLRANHRRREWRLQIH